MKILDNGHRYVAQNFEHPENGQTIQFIERRPKEEGSSELVTVNDGTTNEELLKVVIHRIAVLQAKVPCRENAYALQKLEEGFMWLQMRTAARRLRGVEGTNAK